jgi:hypothetical protein
MPRNLPIGPGFWFPKPPPVPEIQISFFSKLNSPRKYLKTPFQMPRNLPIGPGFWFPKPPPVPEIQISFFSKLNSPRKFLMAPGCSKPAGSLRQNKKTGLASGFRISIQQ